MVAPSRARPVRLTAPWYRWQRQRHEEGHLPRATRPVFLKYDTPEMVNLFLANPQRSYKFDADDAVWVTASSPFDEKLGKIRVLADREAIRCDVRKLFRETHRRTYLVALELHCEQPGLPDAGWDHICELGFVVRRWVPNDRDILAAAMLATEERIGLVVANLRRLGFPTTPSTLVRGGLRVSAVPGETPADLLAIMANNQLLAQTITRFRLEYETLRARRIMLERPNAQQWHTEYWDTHATADAREHDKIGDWVAAGGEQNQRFAREKVYRLYRAIPDPRDRTHRSFGARLLFGSVPTSDMETNDAGEAHFDCDATYEIRAFVRSHRTGCKLRLNAQDCHGPLVWSQPTEPYRIAAHFDSAGTRNLIVNVEMPDLNLAAAVAPKFDTPSIRLKWPAGSKPQLVAGGLGGPSICFKSIPLVTIVATVLLEIFTPIIVGLFQLYYLLYTQFCLGSLGLPPLPDFPAVGPFAALSPETNLKAEYDTLEISAIKSNMTAARTIARTHDLVWEDELLVRPRVDDPMFATVTA